MLRPFLTPLIVSSMLAGLSAPASATSGSRPLAMKIERLLARGLLVEINGIRDKHSLRPVRIYTPLSRTADHHVRDMGRRGYFSHDSANGAEFWKRIERYYPAAGFRHWMVGENLLWSARNLTARSVLRVWMHSPRHRANLLRRDWRQIGISAHRFTSAPSFFHHRRVWLVAIDFGARY